MGNLGLSKLENFLNLVVSTPLLQPLVLGKIGSQEKYLDKTHCWLSKKVFWILEQPWSCLMMLKPFCSLIVSTTREAIAKRDKRKGSVKEGVDKSKAGSRPLSSIMSTTKRTLLFIFFACSIYAHESWLDVFIRAWTLKKQTASRSQQSKANLPKWLQVVIGYDSFVRRPLLKKIGYWPNNMVIVTDNPDN